MSILSQFVVSEPLPVEIGPPFQEIYTYFSLKGMSGLEAHHFYIVHQSRAWRTRKGSPIRRWKAAAYQWIRTAWQMNPQLFDRSVQ